MIRIAPTPFVLLLLLLASPGVPAAGLAGDTGGRYVRQPAVHGDTVVFTAEGDLWTGTVAGGPPRRLTTHAGDESRAAIDPGGRRVAFSASYDGPLEAYVMPLAGGAPRRLSFEYGRALVVGWTPAGEVLYATASSSGQTWSSVLVAVDPDSLARRTLPVADAGDAIVDPSGRWLYFVRFGLGATNDNAVGYRGGALSQLWRLDLAGDAEAQRIGPADANLRQPQWWNGRLLLIADLDGRDNLWTLDADGGDPRPLTGHRDFPVRSVKVHGDRAVYQHGGDLRVLDLATAADRTLPVHLPSDFEQRRTRWLESPLRWLEGTAFAPAGDQVAVLARGRVLLAGLGGRRQVELAVADGVRLRSPVLSPDGRYVYAIADGGGEEEVWRFPADGSSGGQALTDDGGIRRWNLYLSPDGRRLAHDDKRGRLWLLETDSGRNRLIDDDGADGNEGHAEVAWSPDSRHLALVRATGASGRNRIGLYAVDAGRLEWLTSDRYESASPAFSPDGRWLWFLSQREFRLANGSPWGDRNTGPFFDQRTRLYALALQPGLRFPFQPPDELAAAPADKEAGDGTRPRGGGQGAPAIPGPVWDGLAGRLYEAPLPAGNWRRLRIGKDRLFALDRNGGNIALKTLAIDDKGGSPVTLMANVADYDLSGDGGKLYIRTPGSGDRDPGRIHIVEAGGKLPDDLDKATVRLDDWRLRIDPAAEWRQLFADAWRMHRDHFFDAGLRGIDWRAVRERYQPLLARIDDRAALDDLFAQMMAELGALHSQVVPGDARAGSEGAQAGFLGGRFEPVADGWRIVHIHRGDTELPSAAAPLAAPGVDARVGDVITAINGQASAGVRDLSDLLRQQAGRQVLLALRRDGSAPLRTVVVPVDAQREAQLRYGDWVQGRRERVEQAGAGRIGYLHLQAMGGNDMAAFVREFYAQYERDGLVIDVRRNRGGNIDSWIIEKLLRRAWAFWQRPSGQPYTNMQQTFRGHLVVLVDALTYSDGETFAAGVKALGLGPLVGTRTAGAGVWLSDGNRLVDGGRARVAEFPQYGLDGEWLIEGRGVEPDVVVDNPPRASFAGGDAQLEAALALLLDRLQREPVPPLRPRPVPPLSSP